MLAQGWQIGVRGQDRPGLANRSKGQAWPWLANRSDGAGLAQGQPIEARGFGWHRAGQ